MSVPPGSETYSSGEPDMARRLQHVQDIRARLKSQHRVYSKTMAPTVHMDRAEDAERIQVTMILGSVQAAIDLLLKDREEAYKARPDPHLLEVQKQTLAMVKRDMVQVSRPVAAMMGAIFAATFIGNLILATVTVAYIAIAFQAKKLPSYARPVGVYAPAPAPEKDGE